MGASASVVQIPDLTLKEFVQLRKDYDQMSSSPLLFSDELIFSEMEMSLRDIAELKADMEKPIVNLLGEGDEEKGKPMSVAELERKFHEWTFAGKGDPLPLTVDQANIITEGYKTIALSWKRSNIDKCIEYLEKIYKIQTNVIGFPCPPDRDSACYKIARLCYSERQLEQALHYYKECLKLRNNALLELESFTPENSRYDVGDGRVEPPLAVEIEREALKELRKTEKYQDAALKVATIRNDLGILYAAMTRRDKAFQEGTTLRWIPCYKESIYNFHQALDTRSTILGNHVLVANVYQGLAAISKEGMSKTIHNELLKKRMNGMEIQKCVSYYESSLRIRENLCLPSNDKGVLYTKKKLADAHFSLANVYFFEKENCLQAAYKAYSDSYNLRVDVENTLTSEMDYMERQLSKNSPKKIEKGAGFVDDLRQSVESATRTDGYENIAPETPTEENVDVFPPRWYDKYKRADTETREAFFERRKAEDAEELNCNKTHIPKDDGGFYGDCFDKGYEVRPFAAQDDREWYRCIVIFKHPNDSFNVLILENELPSSPNAATLTLLKECRLVSPGNCRFLPEPRSEYSGHMAKEILGVSPENVRKQGQTKSMSELAKTVKPKKKMVEGSLIEGNFRNRGKYLAGKILTKYPTGKFDVEYDNGFVEKKVLQKNLRWPQPLYKQYYPPDVQGEVNASKSADPVSPAKKQQHIDKADLVLTSLSSMPFEWKETHIDATVGINDLVNEYKDIRRDKLVANQKMQQVKAAIIKARDIELERASKRPMQFENSKTMEKDEEVQIVSRQSQLMTKMLKKKEKADKLMKFAAEQKEVKDKKEREREVANLLEIMVEKMDIQHEITHCISGILDTLDRSEMEEKQKIAERADEVQRIQDELLGRTVVP